MDYNLLLILQITENMANYGEIWDDLELLDQLEEMDGEIGCEGVVGRRRRIIVTGEMLVEAM